MKAVIETERLLIRELSLDDALFTLKLVNTPDYIRFIGDKKIKNIPDAEAYLTSGPIVSYRKNGYGLWLVTRKEDLVSIGMCGLINRPFLNAPDIGFAFLPEYFGKGFASEAARATIHFAFTARKLQEVLAITNPINTRSKELLTAIGLKETGTITSPEGNELLLFTITYSEFGQLT